MDVGYDGVEITVAPYFVNGCWWLLSCPEQSIGANSYIM